MSLRVSRASRVPSVLKRRSPAPHSSPTAPPLPCGSCHLLLAPRSQTSDSAPFGRCLRGILCAGTRLTALHSLPGPPRSSPCPSWSRPCCPLRRCPTRPLRRESGGSQEEFPKTWKRPAPDQRSPGSPGSGRRVHRDKEGGRPLRWSHSPSGSGCSSKAAPVPAPGAALRSGSCLKGRATLQAPVSAAGSASAGAKGAA